MYEQSENLNELGAAMAKAQAEISDVITDSVNDGFKRGGNGSRYASLAAVLQVVRPVLSKHGIALLQMPGGDGESVEVQTKLLHSSGQWQSCTLATRPSKLDPQTVGTAITYLRRYMALAMCGIAPDDDDGNTASGMADGLTRPASKPAPRRDDDSHPRDNKEVARIVSLMEACADAEELRIIGKEEGVRDWPNARERAYMLSAAKRIAAGFGQ